MRTPAESFLNVAPCRSSVLPPLMAFRLITILIYVTVFGKILGNAETLIFLSWVEIVYLFIHKIHSVLYPWQIKLDEWQIKLGGILNLATPLHIVKCHYRVPILNLKVSSLYIM